MKNIIGKKGDRKQLGQTAQGEKRSGALQKDGRNPEAGNGPTSPKRKQEQKLTDGRRQTENLKTECKRS